MTRAKRLIPQGKDGTSVVVKDYKISQRNLDARERELLKAGYLVKEISRLDNDYEAGLLALTLKEFKKLNILVGRRNHIGHIRRANERLTKDEGIERAVRDFTDWGGEIGRADDYIEYYYSRY